MLRAIFNQGLFLKKKLGDPQSIFKALTEAKSPSVSHADLEEQGRRGWGNGVGAPGCR